MVQIGWAWVRSKWASNPSIECTWTQSWSRSFFSREFCPTFLNQNSTPSLVNVLNYKTRTSMDGIEEGIEVVVASSPVDAGISCWDLRSGAEYLRHRSCASPPHGLVCVSNRILASSQLRDDSSSSSGSIFYWSWPKVFFFLLFHLKTDVQCVSDISLSQDISMHDTSNASCYLLYSHR